MLFIRCRMQQRPLVLTWARSLMSITPTQS